MWFKRLSKWDVFVGLLGFWVISGAWLWSSAKGLEIIILLTLGLSGLSLFLLQPISFFKKEFFFTCLFLLGLAINPFFALDKWVSLWWVVIYLALFFVYLGVKSLDLNNLSKTKKNDFLFKLANLFFLSYFLVFGLVSWFDLTKYYRLGQVPQIVGPFYWYNQMAGWLILISPLLLWLAYYRRGAGRYLYLLFYSSSLAFLLLTFSRGGMLAWLLASLFILLFLLVSKTVKDFKVFSWSEIGVSILLSLSFVVIFNRQAFGHFWHHSQVLIQESNNHQTAPSISWHYRLIAFRAAGEAIKNFPVTGLGLGNFRYYYRYHQSCPWIMINFVHNQLLELASEGGLLLAFIYLIWLIWVLKRGFTYVLDSTNYFNQRFFVLLLLWGFIGESLHSLIDMDLSLVSLLFYYLVVGGLIIGLTSSNSEINFKLSLMAKIVISSLYVLIVGYLWLGLALNIYLKSELGLAKLNFNHWQTLTQKVIFLYPFNYRNYFLTALGYMRLKKPALAIKFLNKSLSLYPYSGEAYYNLGTIYDLANQSHLAEKYYRQAIKVAPMISPRPYLKLAAFYLRHKRKEDAKEIFNTCLYRAFPKNEAYQALKWMYKYTDVLLLRQACSTELKKLVEAN